MEDFFALSSPNWDPGEALHVANEAAGALKRECSKCQAKPGAFCFPDRGTMHYERWGYGSL